MKMLFKIIFKPQVLKYPYNLNMLLPAPIPHFVAQQFVKAMLSISSSYIAHIFKSPIANDGCTSLK